MENNFTPGRDDDDLPFQFRPKPVSEKKRIQSWNNIANGIEERILFIRRRRRIFFSVTATFILAAGTFWFFNLRDTMPLVVEYKTNYGQVKIIVLPDSSKLVLNANSSVKIPQQWEETSDRQVWLDGEAYFEVAKKITTHQKFIVHTTQVDVEVLGTKFNVNTRRSESIVALAEGKVQLAIKGKGIHIIEKKSNPVIVLKPGEVAKVDSTLNVHVSEDANIDHFAGWVKNEYHFDDTSLGAVAKMIEDVYGYKMIFSDASLINRSISGDLRASNIQEFVQVLQATLNLKINIENKTIIVSRQ
ncbi:MAG TPA: FecR domain-containing protein [Panacibacter sp.]|nr:FecR domain-containing protein [Panacibacter sp.]